MAANLRMMEIMTLSKLLKLFMAIAISFGLLLSCGTKESIEPAFAPVPLDEQFKQKPLRVSLETDTMLVEEFGSEFGQVSELGPIFQRLANVAANITLEQDGGQEYEIDPIIYFAPELDQIRDWEILEGLGLDFLSLKIKNASDWEIAELSFIKEMRLYIDFTLPEEGQTDRRERGILLASYDKELKEGSLKDLGRKIELKIHDIPWKEILKTQRTFVIYTELVVEKVPETKMEVSAEVGVFAQLKVGL